MLFVRKGDLLDRTNHALYELLLHEEENQSSRKRCNDDPCHNHTIVWVIRSTHGGENQRNGFLFWGLQSNQRPEVVVPAVHKGDDCSCCIRGLHNRHIHPEENLQFIQTIQPSSFDDILRERLGVLPEEENQERRGDCRNDYGCKSIQTHERQSAVAQFTENPEQRNHQGCEWNHHREEQEIKDSVPILGAEHFKPIAGSRGNQQCQNGCNNGDNGGVSECSQESTVCGKQVLQVLEQACSKGDRTTVDVNGIIRCTDYHPQKREDGNNGSQN